MSPATTDQLPGRLRDLIGGWAARPDIKALRDPRTARARCNDASRQFSEQAATAGLRADTWPAWADQLGISRQEAELWPDDSHVVCVVWIGERIFTVDWTAAQYGITDPFPLIYEVRELPRRDPWLLTEQEAVEQMRRLRESVQPG